ncbi:MAG: YaiI/YqxD family protein [Pseudomonadota bacterium]
MTRIFVDADACPVKDEIMQVAARRELEVFLVSNGGIRPSRYPEAKSVIVSDGADAADKWIADQIGPGDICVTGDIPLAAKCLDAGAQALRHNGDEFSAANIGNQLAMRDLMADMRAANPLDSSGGGRSFSKSDRSRFLNELERAIRKSSPK